MRKRIRKGGGAGAGRAGAGREPVLPRVKIRRARPADKAAILHFCRRTWGDYGDFIHRVWDEWMTDKRGYFAVAALGKSPIGTAKLTVLRPGEVWFEGLRVDRQFRGIGLAQTLTDFLLKKAAKMGPGSVRYATGGSNVTSQHIGKSWGFELLQRYTCMESTPDGRRKPIPVRVTDAAKLLRLMSGAADRRREAGPGTTGKVGDLSRPGRTRTSAEARLTDLLLSSRFVASTRGLASEGWTFYQIDEDFVRRALRGGELYAVLTDAAGRLPTEREPVVAGLLVAATQRRRGRLLVWTLADLREGSLPLLLNAARRLAHNRGLREVRLVMPYAREFTAPARKAGFHPEYEGLTSVVMQLAKGLPRRRKGA